MKKFILASVALIAVFASCKKEDIRTVYKAEPAKATITVEVFDAYQGMSVTSEATITSSVGTVTNNTIEITGDKGHFNAIPAQKVTITAAYKDYAPKSVTIDILGVLEDQKAFYGATVIVGSAIDPTKPISYDFVPAGTEPEQVIKTGYLAYATHSHNGQMWCINNSEFVLFGTTTYNMYEGINEANSSLTMAAGIEFTDDEEKVCKDIYESLLNAFPEKTSEVVEDEYVVSAFSYFNYKVEYRHSYQLYDIVRVYTLKDSSTKNVPIARIKLANWLTSPQKLEIASPDHASHYVAGHGVDDPHYSHAHGHGGKNAGGGIVVAD